MPEVELERLSPEELTGAWPALSNEERAQGFAMLTRAEAEEFLSHLMAHDTVGVISALPKEERRQWLRFLPPDDVADIIQESAEEEREGLLALLDPAARDDVRALLVYAEDVAGGLMNPRYARLRADMPVSEAIAYLRAQKRLNAELIYYGYVVDAQQRLVGVVSFRQLVTSPPHQAIRELMATDLVTVPDTMDQEHVSHVFAHHDLLCVPVVDAEGRMKGIVTADDIVDVVKEEATEDMHKMGGSEALEAPYLDVALLPMLRKRVVWLIALLLMGFFTVEAMARFEEHIAGLVVLSFFVPLIISCGGNTGSQASTLVVRAMALGEVRLRDWWRVVRREFLVGLLLGLTLALTGMLAALIWNAAWHHLTDSGRMGDRPWHTAVAVACSLQCIVLWGTLCGSMLPFLLRRLGADPASASAPLVATFVDASGLVMYFSVASLVLRLLAP